MIFAKQALLADGWATNVRVALRAGAISALTPGQKPQPGDSRVDTLLPALANVHSHSFQRAMAGMSEYRRAGRDSFWTWRDLMYRFSAHLTPQHVEAIAAMVFLEMLEAGYASVGEFHYLHHQPGGAPYDDLAALSARVAAAAAASGIGLTLLPVLYSYGAAGQGALTPGQARFANGLERYLALLERAQVAVAALPADCRLGIAPHSLRATSPEDLAALLAAHPGLPTHIHIAEQPREVADISAWLGARPVEWLLENAPVGADWCLVHATQMNAQETAALARSGATAGLCPLTEANLGDGPFNGPAFLQAGGSFAIGSDSNLLISLSQELRLLEYSQRLRDKARNLMVLGEGSVGATLYTGAARGGARALGRNSGAIAVGRLADLLAIDSKDAALCALGREQLLDGLVFAANDRVVTDVWSAGRHMVRAGRHLQRAQITASYRAAMRDLLARL